MKRVRCPKCDNYIRFDENRYEPGRKLVFQCPQCGREFAIRIKSTAETSSPEGGGDDVVGHIVVIENVFHVKQELPLHMGDNVIGRYH